LYGPRQPSCSKQHGPKLTYRDQDFEGQKLAETLSTALLSVVGVRHNSMPLITNGRMEDRLSNTRLCLAHCLRRWLRPPRYQTRRLHRSRRRRSHISGRCPRLAFLQQEPCQMAPSTGRPSHFSATESGYRREGNTVKHMPYGMVRACNKHNWA